MFIKLSTIQKAVLALIVANIIWGAASPIFKLSLQNIPPFTLAFWRFFLGSGILLLILRKKARLSLHRRKDLAWLLAYTFLGITVNIIFFFLGLQLTYAINAPVIASASPILTLIFATLLLKETFRWRKLAGMALGCLGIIIVVTEPLLEKGLNGSIVGNIFLLIAVLGAVGGNVVGRKIFPRYNTLMLTYWCFVIGAASFLPLALYEYLKTPSLYSLLDWRGFTGLFYGSIFSSTIAYSLFAWGLSKLDATDSAMFTYIDPIAGGILAVLLLHEPITTLFLLGSALIFGGIGIAEGRLHYHPIFKLRPPAKHRPDISTDKTPDTGKVISRIFQNRR